ncbi:MAG: nucleotidyltransferase family protein [Labilithrix sp.]|nr:nucleotidyltransferase family protein [Labilithrix sp.]MCW5813474.1 nucleotidyltransferase family protein [Labilithrix sp.]
MVRPVARQFYEDTLRTLVRRRVPFLVGGALALKHFAGIARDTKDLDIFLRARDVDRALEVLADEGFEVEKCFPHWLAKAWSGPHFVDFIYASANGLCAVDDRWFEHAAGCTLWGVPVLVSGAEEMIASKCFVMERERFDGADIYHLLEACGPDLDWSRLLSHFGEHWRVLLGHLVFFSFVYPQKRHCVPRHVMNALLERAKAEHRPEDVEVCRGTLLSREQYLVDLRERGYADARVAPHGNVAPKDLEIWTDAIGRRP